MKTIIKMAILASLAAAASCGEKNEGFRYTVDQFADIKVMRYRIPGWESLSLQQKTYVYYLSEAAKYGRDITWDQYCRWNLPVRHAIEEVLRNYAGDRGCEEFQAFTEYAKRVFFSNGVHHHYAEDKFVPACPKEYFASLLEAVGKSDGQLLDFIYDKDDLFQRRSTSREGDIVALSAVNFYEGGLTRKEVDDFYHKMEKPGDPRPVSYGLNSKVVKDSRGKVFEKVWKLDGIYGPAIAKICENLEKASLYAENEIQKRAIGLLVEYYRTGDLRKWDEYNIEWVKDTVGTVDFINGFIEDYDDPLGRKATWEGMVHLKDSAASARTEALSANAQWFEDNSPVDPRFKKKSVKGVSAKVVNAATLAGATYPATPIGINLPNADWIRKEHGSKSVTIANITHTYDYSANEQPRSVLSEFAWDDDEIRLQKKYGDYADEVHTDLHECLGHASGQLLEGTKPTALGEYQSALEEARADLFGLYYIADPKLVELGIMPDTEAYKPHYSGYIRNGIMTQFTRVEPGRPNTEAHMQNRKLIAEWCYEKGAANNVIEKRSRGGKTYFVVNDYEALRGLFAELLAEIQRIKSEGDYEAGKTLIETYAVDIDPDLHKEVLERYNALNLKPYGGFINPEFIPSFAEDGSIVAVEVSYPDDYLGQQLYYGERYGTL